MPAQEVVIDCFACADIKKLVPDLITTLVAYPDHFITYVAHDPHEAAFKDNKISLIEDMIFEAIGFMYKDAQSLNPEPGEKIFKVHAKKSFTTVVAIPRHVYTRKQEKSHPAAKSLLIQMPVPVRSKMTLAEVNAMSQQMTKLSINMEALKVAARNNEEPSDEIYAELMEAEDLVMHMVNVATMHCVEAKMKEIELKKQRKEKAKLKKEKKKQQEEEETCEVAKKLPDRFGCFRAAMAETCVQGSELDEAIEPLVERFVKKMACSEEKSDGKFS